MQFTIATILLLLFGAAAYGYWKRQKSIQVKHWIEPEQFELNDPILGKCDVTLPAIGQNQSRGFIKLTLEINGTPVEFSNSFGPDELDHAIRDLQTYFRLATDAERMKYFKNSISSQMEIHRLLVPKSKLTDAELKSTTRLLFVQAMGPTALFIFSSKKFVGGRPVYVTVTQDGDVDFVGVG